MTQLFVSLGTDHHPFPRLLGWVAAWGLEHPGWRLVVQHGLSPAPAGCTAFPFCDHDRLQELVAESEIVVSHGGPATITEARRHGHLPVVVPRDPRLAEHVDDHQLLFSRRLGASGLVYLAETEEEFRTALKLAERTPQERAEATLAYDVPEGVFKVGHAAEELVRARRHPRG